jgi:threonine/homoserine/homoserine lactone efflux protein
MDHPHPLSAGSVFGDCPQLFMTLVRLTIRSISSNPLQTRLSSCPSNAGRGSDIEITIFVKGMAVGFFICAPVGPIGVYCVRKALLEGRAAGFLSLIGAAAGDGLYCALAGLGITYVADLLQQEQDLVRLVAGMVLIFLGAKIFFSQPVEKRLRTQRQGPSGSFLSGLILMLANPLVILIFTATFTALGVHGWRADYLSTFCLVTGVYSGSALWAFLLAAAVTFLQGGMDPHLRLLNRISGAFIAGFGFVVGLLTFIGYRIPVR